MSDRVEDGAPPKTIKVDRGITGITIPFHDRQYVKVYDFAGKTIFHGLAGAVTVEVLGPKEKP